MSRPLRVCFAAYRGNMRCGGQGVYLWFLARELARLGHTVDVLVGPPYPDPMPFAREVSRTHLAVLQEAVRKSPEWATKFARDVPGADVDYLYEAVRHEPLWEMKFQQDVRRKPKKK